jgi:hypothetical protein
VTDHRPATLETATTVPPVDTEEDAPHRKEETIEVMMAK